LYVKPLPDEKHPSEVDVLRASDVTDRAASSTEAAMNVREDVDFMIDRGLMAVASRSMKRTIRFGVHWDGRL
jgi:hypothetical protein